MFLRLRAALGEGVAGSFLRQSRGGNSREGMELDFKGKIFQVFPCFCCLARMCLGAEMSKVTKIENFRILHCCVIITTIFQYTVNCTSLHITLAVFSLKKVPVNRKERSVTIRRLI